jgi:hypothetical protein
MSSWGGGCLREDLTLLGLYTRISYTTGGNRGPFYAEKHRLERPTEHPIGIDNPGVIGPVFSCPQEPEVFNAHMQSRADDLRVFDIDAPIG